MRKPQSVRQSEIIIYACTVASALVGLIDRWLSLIGPGEFAVQLVLYGLLCIVPYKIGQGSNSARYVFAIGVVITTLLMVGGGVKIPRLDFILSVVMIPVEIYVIWILFQPAASRWFTGEGDDDSGKPSWYEPKEFREPR